MCLRTSILTEEYYRFECGVGMVTRVVLFAFIFVLCFCFALSPATQPCTDNTCNTMDTSNLSMSVSFLKDDVDAFFVFFC